MFTISVFAKNEEENIPFVVDRLLAGYDAGRIAFVLDGDIEPTARILTERRIRFIQGPDKGKGPPYDTPSGTSIPSSWSLWTLTGLMIPMK